MPDYRISLNALPSMGETFTVDDQSVWLVPIAECGMDCRIVEPLVGEVTLLPQDEGCLVRGTVTGKVLLPCDRCAEDASIDIRGKFESFEPYPSETDEEDEEDFDSDADEFIIHLVDGSPEIDLAALCWEEFVLALPVRPLCAPDCKGLCPQCGANLNEGSCSCTRDEGDPRLAVLRGLTLTKH